MKLSAGCCSFVCRGSLLIRLCTVRKFYVQMHKHIKIILLSTPSPPNAQRNSVYEDKGLVATGNQRQGRALPCASAPCGRTQGWGCLRTPQGGASSSTAQAALSPAHPDSQEGQRHLSDVVQSCCFPISQKCLIQLDQNLLSP